MIVETAMTEARGAPRSRVTERMPPARGRGEVCGRSRECARVLYHLWKTRVIQLVRTW